MKSMGAVIHAAARWSLTKRRSGVAEIVGEDLAMSNTIDIIYCSNWHCHNTDCARNRENQPWNVETRQRRWFPSENGECEGELLKRSKGDVERQ